MNNLNGFLTDIEKRLPEIPEDRAYWLLRTRAGKYYEEFHKQKYVGLDYNDISYFHLNELYKSHLGRIDSKEFISAVNERVRLVYPNEERPGLIASQLIRFTYSIKKDDIVLIPSEGSQSIVIGKVVDGRISGNSNSIQSSSSPSVYIKDVHWIKEISRDKMDPSLYLVFQAHQALNDVSKYSNFIERTIGNFYIDGQVGNLVLNIKSNSSTPAMSVFESGYCLLKLIDQFFEEYRLDHSSGVLEVKVSLNSDGKFQFKGGIRKVLVGALIVLGINGGGLQVEFRDFHLDMTTRGIIEAVNDFLDHRAENRLKEKLSENTRTLNMQQPTDVKELLKAASK